MIPSSLAGERVGEFGEKFRKEREKKGISLDDVSNVTKISSRMLKAIEDEHFDQLPGGVFNKGFIRTYAKHLGMNDEEAVNGYLACMRQAQVDAQEAWQPARSADRRITPDRRSSAASRTSASNQQTEVEELPELHLPRAEDVRPPRKNYIQQTDSGIPWRIVAVSALVVVLAILLWTRHSHNVRISSAASAPAQSAPVATPAAAPPAVHQATPAASIAKAAPAPHPSATNTQSQTAPAKTTTNSAPKNPPAQSPQSATPQSATLQSAAPPPATQQPAAESPAPLTLVIRASENSWISITADGQAVSQETLIAPAHTSFRASREIVAKVGNAAGVSFLWNGKEIPPDGAEAEVRTYVFTPDGMRVSGQ